MEKQHPVPPTLTKDIILISCAAVCQNGGTDKQLRDKWLTSYLELIPDSEWTDIDEELKNLHGDFKGDMLTTLFGLSVAFHFLKPCLEEKEYRKRHPYLHWLKSFFHHLPFWHKLREKLK